MEKVLIIERANKRYRGFYVFFDVYNVDNSDFVREFVSKKNLNKNSTYHYRIKKRLVK